MDRKGRPNLAIISWVAAFLQMQQSPVFTSRVCGRDNVFVKSVLVLSVCVYVCVCVRATTFEWVDRETSFLVCCYILTISRSSLNIKVIGSRSRSSWKMLILLPGPEFNLVWLVWSQGHKWGQGPTKVKVISRSIVSVWLSISKPEVGLRLKGILVIIYCRPWPLAMTSL